MKLSKLSLMPILLMCGIIACNEQFDSQPITEDTNTTMEWQDVIRNFDFDRNIIIVETDASIQEAIDHANIGDAIYIEPGIYNETLTITKEDIELIGLSNEANEVVILQNKGDSGAAITAIEGTKVYNIQAKGFDEMGITVRSFDVSELKGRQNKIKMNRMSLGNSIYHYTFELSLGNGEFDYVTIHRVTKESNKYKPIKTKSNVFMVHGAIQDFDDIFLTAGAEEINETTSAPYYLASNGIDVWGIDLGWTKVPLETTDFSFMEHWGVDKDINHTLKSMSVARLIRGLSRQSFCKMNLLGFSYGVHVTYGAASYETQQHKKVRNIKGIIPVDGQLKYLNADKVMKECDAAAEQKSLIESGQYHNPWGVGLIQLGGMTLTAPNEMSPVPDFAGLTNLQMMNAIGSNGEEWHFFGGTPFELYYTEPMRFVRLSEGLSPHMPRLMFYEMAATSCPSQDVSFDDYLHKIKVPIFYISAQGGEGSAGDYTSSLTSSTDIEWLNINDPLQEDATDFGHADLWMSYQASEWVWEPLRQWLINH